MHKFFFGGFHRIPYLRRFLFTREFYYVTVGNVIQKKLPGLPMDKIRGGGYYFTPFGNTKKKGGKYIDFPVKELKEIYEGSFAIFH